MNNHVYATTPARTLQALEWSSTLCDGSTVDHATAEAACAELGDGWRLPTIEELLSLVDYAYRAPAVDTDAFPDTRCEWYWTNTTCSWSSDFVWTVEFHTGFGSETSRSGGRACVRAVREVTP